MLLSLGAVMLRTKRGIIDNMPDQMSELKLIAIRTDRLLRRYIEIHDAVYKFSWRKIVPLPFIYKPIDFSSLNSQLKEILLELQEDVQAISHLLEVTQGQESHFGNVLLEYGEALIQAISFLEEITYLLTLKSNGSRDYSYTEHNEKCELYANAVSRYVSIGNELNDLYQM